jgi:hypothetical protein
MDMLHPHGVCILVTATATAMATAADRRIFQVYYDLARFGNYLASFFSVCAFGGISKKDKNGCR